MKTASEMTFNEFVDTATQQIHSALLEGGGKQMRSSVHALVATVLNITNAKWPNKYTE